ncbi:MAG: hypothetical protein Q9199_003187 [Rusavskia elegans]
MKPKTLSRPERGHSGRPVYPSRKAAHDLEEYQVQLETHVHAGKLSESGKFVKFKNIPYAEPPLGELRFAPPQHIFENNETVNYGWNENVCPQVQMGWAPKASEFLADFQDPPALANWTDPISAADYGPIQYPPKDASEDCLTLDVMVPKTVWDSRNENVVYKFIVWVHGGGFVYGWKDQYGSPEGLFDAATSEDEQNVIYVAMNYRLGAFGWLGGSTYVESDGSANIGLLDQAFAMKVTMMGQGAGASSIMHHIAASDHDFKPRMKAAIIQSPGFFPQPDETQNDEMYTKFLELAKVEDYEALLTADTKVLQHANAKMVHESKYGYFNFGPTIDGGYVRDLPGKILAQDQLDIPAMLLGHEKADGLLFTPPWIRTTEALLDHVRGLFPNVPQSVLDMISSDYTVPTKSGPQLSLLAAADFFNDIAIQCNSFYLTEASPNSTSKHPHPVYRYVFNALPAIHGYDTGYTYYPSPPLIPPVNENLAKYFQESIVNFARYLDPNAEDSTAWEEYTSENRKVMNMGKLVQVKPDYSHILGPDPMDSFR